MFAVIKKEFKSYFYSPVGYVFIGLFLIMFSIFFYVDVFQYQSTNFEYIFYSGATILTFLVPILTMRAIAEEKFEKEGLKFDKYYWAQRGKADVCVKEKIDVMIDDNYMNCLEIAEKNIKTLYFRDAGIKEIKDNSHITEVHNWGEIYKYIHMYNNEINS